MANQFIGLHMLVTLRDPPARLKGTVSDIEAGRSLTLSNVWILDTHDWQPRVTIQADNIIDLSEVPETQAQVPASAAQPPLQPAVHQQQPHRPPSIPQPSHVPFADPAILSVGRRPESGSKRTPDSQNHPNTSEKRDLQPPIPSVQIENSAGDLTPTGAISESVKGLKLENTPPGVAVESADEENQDLNPDSTTQDIQAGGQKKKRRQRGGRNIRGGAQGREDGGESPQAGRGNPGNRGKGWRQTPILQSTASFQPFNSLKRNGGRGRGGHQNDNGWASEDVTDVQEMGDFDFEGGLAKFDKDTLFDQMRKEDQVDDADRLVSHNRQSRPKPGTAGGKNLHYSENVLDMPSTSSKQPKDTANDFWNSEADDRVLDGGERLSGREQGSRQSSRRGESKMSTTRRSQSRKASATTSGQGPSRLNTGFSGAASPQGFHLVPSNRRVEPVSALQMLNLENIAHNELGLTDEMMTENAGRGIAEVALTALSDPAIRVRTAGSADPMTGNLPPPTIVILAGNNKSGGRAVAAGRHLRNKGVNVLVCVVGMDRGADGNLLEEMRQQVRLFRNFGGRIYNKGELFEHLRKASIPTLSIDAPRTSLGPLANPAPVTLIIDALLGLAISFEELRTSDQATVYELIEWANRNEAFVLAVDLPTGIDPSSGKISIIDGSRLYVKPRYVVSMAAPKRGLLEVIMSSENGSDDTVSADAAVSDDSALEWKLFVADMGFGAAVWKKAGTKIRRGVDFDDKWVSEMRYRGTPTEAGDE